MERMSDKEIVREYNEAKNKNEQITILADLNLMQESDIKDILAKNGIKVSGKRGRKKMEKAAVDDVPVKKVTKAAVDDIPKTNVAKAAVERPKMEPVKITVLPKMPNTVQDLLTKRMIVCQTSIDKYTKELKEINEFLGGFENEKVD